MSFKSRTITGLDGLIEEITNNVLARVNKKLQVNMLCYRPVGDLFGSLSNTIPAGARVLDGSVIYCADAEGKIKPEFEEFWNFVNNARNITEQEYANEMNTYGQCCAFVINEIAKTIKLPTFSTGTLWSGTKGVGGTYAAGLPNITGEFATEANRSGSTGGYYTKGAFYPPNYSALLDNGRIKKHIAAPVADDNMPIGFDASKSNSTYGRSDVVQPQAMGVIWCIQVETIPIDILEELGVTTPTEDPNFIELRARLETHESNSLVHVTPTDKSNWNNISTTIMQQVILPPDLNNCIAVNDIQEYTAPADGWALVKCRAGGETGNILVDGHVYGGFHIGHALNLAMIVPVLEGQSIQCMRSSCFGFKEDENGYPRPVTPDDLSSLIAFNVEFYPYKKQ